MWGRPMPDNPWSRASSNGRFAPSLIMLLAYLSLLYSFSLEVDLRCELCLTTGGCGRDQAEVTG